MKMNLVEFCKSSKRTLAGGELKISYQNDVNLLHSAIGVSTEVGEIIEAMNGKERHEIDIVNLSEECADVMWYLAIPIRDYALDFGKYNSLATIELNVPQLIIDSANFLDMMKKSAFYGKPIKTEDVDNHVTNLYVHMISMAEYYGFDLEVAMSNNQDKLRKRFPEKFEEGQALNRDTGVERTELEKGM